MLFLHAVLHAANLFVGTEAAKQGSRGMCERSGGRWTGRGGKKEQTQEGKRKRRNEKQERRINGSGETGRGRGTAVRIEQVCRGEIRVLQVSLQDCYIDLKGSKTKRCAESFITGSRRVDIISNAVLALYYKAIIPNTCRRAHAHTHYIV